MCDASCSAEIYQFRIVLRHTSPHVWRRILVRSDATVADLHHTLQVAFGWTDSRPHRFLIRGKAYGIHHADGPVFQDNAHLLRLADFCFLPKERFLYEYDCHPGSRSLWQHQVRCERMLPVESQRLYPVCIGGVGAAPPENCGGPKGLAEFRGLFTPRFILHRLATMLDEGPTEKGIQELRHLRPWITLNECDRRQINRKLKPESKSVDRGKGELDENRNPHHHQVG